MNKQTHNTIVKYLSILFLFFTTFGFAETVTKQLYLSDPSQSLDRIDPVATADGSTAQTVVLSSGGTSSITIVGTAAFSNSARTVNSHSFSYSSGTTGLNRVLMVGISYRDSDENVAVSSVTYAGQPMTQVSTTSNANDGDVYIFRLVNPPTGSNTLTVNYSNNLQDGSVIGAVTYEGVNQSTPTGTPSTNTGTSTTPSVTVAGATGRLMFGVVAGRTDGQDYVVTNGGTQLWTSRPFNGDTAGSGQQKAGASSVALTWSGGNDEWAAAGVSIIPYIPVNNVTFTETPALCSDLIIESGTISVTNYISIVSGTMPINPDINATLKYGATDIITLSNPTYDSGTGLLTWTGALGASVTVPAGESIVLDVTTAQTGVTFTIDYDSASKPSKIDLPVSTYIDITSLDVYDAAYPGGNVVDYGLGGATVYARATVTDPFGFDDITGMDLTITPDGSTVSATSVQTAGCSRTYEYTWTTPLAAAETYNLLATAQEGFEATVTDTQDTNYTTCTICPPNAIDDDITGAAGVPIFIDVLKNDSDLNDNLDISSLTIITSPTSGVAEISGGKIQYIPAGAFTGNDTLVYEVCDTSTPDPLCSQATVYITISEAIGDACGEANLEHTYFIPYPEEQARIALLASKSNTIGINDIRTIISIKAPYPNTIITWDHWEDGYEADPQNPVQTTTEIWGDGNLYNGVAPGYETTDIIPGGGSFVFDETIDVTPRNASIIFHDGRDKIITSSQVTIAQVLGEPGLITVQAMKTNVTSTLEYGQSFIIPAGEDLASQDFQYTALFIRASQDATTVRIDKDADGIFEETIVLNEGESYLVDGGVLTGAKVISTAPVGVDAHFGGVDTYSSREVPIYPAPWYGNTYYTAVPTTGPSTAAPDEAVVMLYNYQAHDITVNWERGVGTAPNSGSIVVPAQSAVPFILDYSNTDGSTRGAAYKFTSLTGDAFIAIEMVDTYYNGGNGTSRDWSFNLIAEKRLSDFTAIAWAPGGLDGNNDGTPDVNYNPIWVTPTADTTVYVKWDGDVAGATGTLSSCELKYDDSYTLNALTHLRLYDPSGDNDQGGSALFTCDGAKLSVVYGEDPAVAAIGGTSWDVGTTLQPFCKERLILAANDFYTTQPDTSVVIDVLANDTGFLATIDPSTVSNAFLTYPSNGNIVINIDGTITYIPNAGFEGTDTFEYSVCSIEDSSVCDKATVTILVTSCNANANNALISGGVYLELDPDDGNYTNEALLQGRRVDLYSDTGVIGIIDGTDAVIQTMLTSVAGLYNFAVPSTGNYIIKVNTDDGQYDPALLNTQTVSISALDTCSNDLYLGVKPVLVAVDDIGSGGVDNPIIIAILDNDFGESNASSVTTDGLLQPANGTVTVNVDGTVTYTPNPGYIGIDTFEYRVCSAEDPGLCDVAEVSITISCIVISGFNTINGSVFDDTNFNGVFDTGEVTLSANVSVQLYKDINGDGIINDGATPTTVITDLQGNYQFTVAYTSVNENVRDEFTTIGSGAGNNGSVNWTNNWIEIVENDGLNNGDIRVDDFIGTLTGNELRIRDDGSDDGGGAGQGVYRTVDLSSASSATLTYSYDEDGLDDNGDYVAVYISTVPNPNANPGSTDWTEIRRHEGGDNDDNGNVSIDISAYISANTSIRFLSSPQLGRSDQVYFDDVDISFIGTTYDPNFIVRIDTASIPAGYVLSTPGEITVGFTGIDQGSCGNNFGVYIPKADLSVNKILVTSPPFVPGQSITYNIMVQNAGPNTATDINMTDLPTNLKVTSATGPTSICSITPALGMTTSVDCNTPSLGAGSIETITIIATVP